MADRVVIVGARRGNTTIPISELKQMMGRAGRKHGIGTTAEVDVVVEESDELYFSDGMQDNSGMDVLSAMGKLDELCFHILPEISAGRVKDKKTAHQWFSRSFRALQGGKFDADEVFSALLELEAIQEAAGRFSTTMLGEASVAFYFHPADVLAWKMNFDELFEGGMEYDEVAPAWALGSIPCNRAFGDMGDHRSVIHDCLNKLPAGFEVMEGALVNVTLWWHCMGGLPVGKMKNVAMAMRKDFGRIRGLLNYLDHKVAHWKKTNYFDELEMRVNKGITSELLELCKLPGISKGRAAYLYNTGVANLEDLKEQAGNFEGEIEEDFWNAIKRLV